jgi:large subunit ribosomal protein L23
MNEPYDIIQNVHLTEKATILAETGNQYVFRVRPNANKVQIRQAIEKLFKKKVVRVNTVNVGGKYKRGRTQHPGRTSDWKKAIVTLAPGEKLEFA